MDEPKKALFTPRTRLELQQAMWDLWQSGLEMSAAAAVNRPGFIGGLVV